MTPTLTEAEAYVISRSNDASVEFTLNKPQKAREELEAMQPVLDRVVDSAAEVRLALKKVIEAFETSLTNPIMGTTEVSRYLDACTEARDVLKKAEDMK
jgi:hypothetical protein